MADGRQVEKQTVEFEAGRGAHPFLLGDDLYDVLLKLRGLIRFFRDIDVRFDESDPLGFPILVCLVDAGLNLVFEATTQALVRIEKFEPGAQRAQERNKRLRFTQMAGAGDLALVDFVGLPTSESGGRSERYRDVARVYRAAHAVRYDAAKEALFLVYPGISFVFDVRSDNVSRYTADPNALPGDHENYSRAIIEAMPGEVAPAPRNLVQICGDGLIFDGDAERCICFGDPVQEVLSQLGEPDDIYSPEEHPASQLYRILNYFSRGLDVVTFADTHTVAKFVLHTNLPTHPDFGHYSKATFCMQEDDSLTANVRFADFQESQVFDFEEPIAARYTVANGPNDDPDARSYLHYNIYKAPTRGIHFEVDALSGLVATVTFHPVEGL